MRKLLRPYMAVEELERRDCPAVTIQYMSSMLLIRGAPQGELLVEGQGGNVFQIKDGAATLGTYSLNRNLFILTPYRSAPISIDLKDSSIAGNVLVDLGNGFTGNPALDASVDVYDSVTNATIGEVGDSVTILRGNGRESVSIGANNDTSVGGVFDSKPVSIRGNVTAIGRTSVNKVDTFQVSSGTEIRGDVQTVHYENVTLGEQGVGIANVFGNVTVSRPSTGPGMKVDLYADVRGNVNVVAGGTAIGSNSFSLQSPDTVVDSHIGGYLNVNFGEAVQGNVISLIADDAGPATSRVDGHVFLTSNNGLADLTQPNQFNIEGQINGSLRITMGSDANQVNFGIKATATPPQTAVNGSVFIAGGNGDNIIQNADVMGSLRGSIGGGLDIRFGNGNDTVNIGGDGVDSDFMIAGPIRYRSGHGSSTVTVSTQNTTLPENNYTIDMLFGNGDDSLTFTAASTGLINGRANGGGGLNTFNQGGVTLATTFALDNF